MTNTPTTPDDKELDSKEFETKVDKLRMDMDEAKRKAEFERFPRSGSGSDLEHHRRVSAQRRRYLGSVGEQEGWQTLSAKLIEDTKSILISAKSAIKKDEGAKPLKGKNPHIEIGDEGKTPVKKEGSSDGK